MNPDSCEVASAVELQWSLAQQKETVVSFLQKVTEGLMLACQHTVTALWQHLEKMVTVQNVEKRGTFAAGPGLKIPQVFEVMVDFWGTAGLLGMAVQNLAVQNLSRQGKVGQGIIPDVLVIAAQEQTAPEPWLLVQH